jgi:hypothetical protein
MVGDAAVATNEVIIPITNTSLSFVIIKLLRVEQQVAST